MRWSVTLLPPPSWNNSYRIVKQTRRSAAGKPYSYHTMAKTNKLVEYQAQMLMVVRAAKPSRWKPKKWVRIYWRVFLTRHIDMDNMQKAVNDVIEEATGVNDKWFLPIFDVEPVIGVPKREARIELIIEG